MNPGPDPAIVRALLDDHGFSYAHEAGIRIERATPAVLFQLLCLALLLNAPIHAGNATRAAKALLDAKLNTAERMVAASWQQRVDVLTTHGYKRFDERASTMLGETAERVLSEYDGDLRNLRAAAEYDVERAHELLQEFKGIGPVGADIFLREVQGVWDEVHPFADERVLAAADKLELGKTARELSELVARSEFVDLVAALVRVDLSDGYERLRARVG